MVDSAVRRGLIAMATILTALTYLYVTTSRAPKKNSIRDTDEGEETDNAYGIDESENLLNLVVKIANEQAIQDTRVHKSVSCNNCHMSPLRGIRFKCVNCIDFDLCAQCEALESHSKTHLFLKIVIPIPPHANPRSMVLKPFYPGLPWVNTKRRRRLTSFDTSALEFETHFDGLEIEALYEQFQSLSTLDGDGGITRDTFDYCVGYLKNLSSIITDRIFNFFDQDHDGIISFEEMVRGCSILNKGTFEERVKYAFEGYDLNGDGRISRLEFAKLFKAFFQLNMGMVRGAVKVLEQGMLESFDDEAEKPVSAAFGAPFEASTERDNSRLYTKFNESDEEVSPIRDTPKTRFDLSPTRAIDNEFIDMEDPIINNVAQNATEEMIAQIFESVDQTESLSFQEFRKAAGIDVNILAWFESLGSVF